MFCKMCTVEKCENIHHNNGRTFFSFSTTHTVRKFQDFSATTQILREINFGLFEARKTVIFTFRGYKV